MPVYFLHIMNREEMEQFYLNTPAFQAGVRAKPETNKYLITAATLVGTTYVVCNSKLVGGCSDQDKVINHTNKEKEEEKGYRKW